MGAEEAEARDIAVTSAGAAMLTELADQVAPGRAAVVVVDVQKDFCASDGAMATVWRLDLTAIQAAVARLNQFIDGARAARIPVAWVREVFSQERMLPNARVINGDGDDLHLIREGSDGTDWYAESRQPLEKEPVFTKWNYDAFENTDLDLWLRSHGIETLIFGGFTTNVCVETSARHAYIKGYYTIVLSDCTGAPDPSEHESALTNIRKYFGRVEESTAIVDAWKATAGT